MTIRAAVNGPLWVDSSPSAQPQKRHSLGLLAGIILLKDMMFTE